MATAEELLMQTVNTNETVEVLTVDMNTRVISIPATIRVLGVESDDDVKRLHFSLPRYYGEFDLSEFKVQINFRNARGEGDFYPTDDLETTTDKITFSWLVDRSAFKYFGDVDFSICMKKYNSVGVVEKEFNTTFASLPVLRGLETTKAVVENNPSAFDVVLFRLYAVEAATGNGQDGYYTVAKVEENSLGVTVTIIDKNGETVAVVRHGVDGYTPLKGVDYWTDEDKVEIQTESNARVKAYIDNWAPVYQAVTLLASGWDSEVKQTVSVHGVTEDNIIYVAPEPSYENYSKYVSCGIRCIEQSEDSLTFECVTIPTIDIVANVTVHYGSEMLDKSPNFTVSDDGEGNVVIDI